MSYQVLALKWRPQQFTEMKGQQPVLQALANALDTGRLHHAYLFTGTHGVGKTSVARILAKCLSCERGVSSNPCGTCTACAGIEKGHYPDLLEIDAASRTRVEDTRELLGQVQYSPVIGRYKVYLIDEVHMLSTHSFNALLKTLEEPPSHVIFLLATTDPQKLPMTVLSRCLQFHLKNMSIEQIARHLTHILEQEKIVFEAEALELLAKAANGSMRDALSLLEQAIAYGAQTVTATDVRMMLGIVPLDQVLDLLDALALQDGKKIIESIEVAALEGLDFANLLEELLSQLSRIALLQVVPTTDAVIHQGATLKLLSERMSREDVQLYYQIALLGRRDLPLAPTFRLGFTMVMLRMLAFRLQQPSRAESEPMQFIKKTVVSPPQIQVQSSVSSKAVVAKGAQDWAALIARLALTGGLKTLADYCVLERWENNRIILQVDPGQAAMVNTRIKQRFIEEVSKALDQPVDIVLTISPEKLACPAHVKNETERQQLQEATQTLQNDLQLSALMERFDAKIQVDSIALKLEEPC